MDGRFYQHNNHPHDETQDRQKPIVVFCDAPPDDLAHIHKTGINTGQKNCQAQEGVEEALDDAAQLALLNLELGQIHDEKQC